MTPSKTALASLGLLCGLGLLVTACPAVLDDECAEGACGPRTNAGEGGVDTGIDSAVVPPGCKPELDPKDSAPCVVNDYGVFVAPNGKADAPGTREAPVNSVANALKKLGNKPRIYVCKGSYPETIELSVPVAVYGGFTCDSWAYSGDKASFNAAKPGDYALRVRGVSAEVTLADLQLTAMPGDATNRSSIAAFVSDSPKVILRRVALVAGAGHAGDDGTEGTTGVPTPSDLNGNPPLPQSGGGNGGPAKLCTCSSGGTSKGGRGGDTLGVNNNGEAGETAIAPPVPATATGAAQTAAECLGGVIFARAGSDAPAGGNAPSPSAVGEVANDGWKPGNGEAGISGKPGQGGGGAGGNSGGGSPGGGGGGACGGCGGTGGSGGTAGGSSIALLAFKAPVRLENSTLAAAGAGAGGIGKIGGGPQVGGSGGVRAGSCSGAAGGTGGGGGAGAGGSGGISAGILHKDGAPITDSATEAAIAIGTAGAAGPGGIPQTNDGKPGDAKKIHGL